MNNVNFEYYKIFYYTAKCGNISRAADALFVTQPSITKGIQKLEAQLDCILFTRTSRGMRLTEEGRILFERIGPACESIINAEDEIYRLKHMETGTVRLNSISTILDSILIPDIADFTALNQNIKFEIIKDNFSTISREFLKGNMDISLDFEDILYQELPLLKEIGLELEVWAGRKIEIVPVAGTRYRDLVGRELTTEDIAKHPLILKTIPADKTGKDFYHAMFRSGAYIDQRDYIANTLNMRISMAKNNMGITFVPLDSVYDYVEMEKLFVLNYSGLLPQKRLVVFRNANWTLSIAAKEFLDYLIDREELEHIPFPRSAEIQATDIL